MPSPPIETVTLPSRSDGRAGGDAVQYPVRWNRSRRARRVSLRIDPHAGAVVVTLPPRTARRAGMALLHAHAAWVRESLAALAPATPLTPGAMVPIAGVPHRIRLVPGTRREEAWIEAGVIRTPGPRAAVPAQLLRLLRANVQHRIDVVAARHAALLGVHVAGIRLKDTRSRWGSCAPNGMLAFSWRLAMAPEWVLDYVVAHEVAHLRELNHSDRFWRHVARLCRDRAAAVAWLKAEGPRLLRVGQADAS
jgi:predicted metal-dependent hydrolase